MRNQLRKWVFGVLLVAGVSLAPAAFARSHVRVGVGINLPGLSIGVSNWGHGGYAYGGYGWAGNKGYGSAGHFAAIAELGATDFHRRSWLKQPALLAP